MRRAVLMMRQAISPRLAIRIFLNIAPLREKRQAFPPRTFLLERGKRVNKRSPEGWRLGRRGGRVGPLQEQTSTCSPRVLEPRAGHVAAISRPQNRRGERRSGPRIAAEAKIARADYPIDPLGRVDVGLSFGCARLRKDAETSEKATAASAMRLCPCRDTRRSRPACDASWAPLSDSARNRRPQGASPGIAGESYRAVARSAASAPSQPRAAARSLTAATNQSGAR